MICNVIAPTLPGTPYHPPTPPLPLPLPYTSPASSENLARALYPRLREWLFKDNYTLTIMVLILIFLLILFLKKVCFFLVRFGLFWFNLVFFKPIWFNLLLFGLFWFCFK